MSQASKHLDWCLNKAKREIEECKKQGKIIKHRGLIKIKPDIIEAEKHLKKAEHNFNAIGSFQETGFSDWSISAGFYCIYHCFLAIAAKFGYESRNQECTISLIECLKEEGKININSKFIEILKHQDIEEIQENKDKSNFFAHKGGQMRLVAKKMREKAEAMEEEMVDVRKEDKTIRAFTIPSQPEIIGEVINISSVSVFKNHKMTTTLETAQGIGHYRFALEETVGLYLNI